jgi:hypothetical protein
MILAYSSDRKIGSPYPDKLQNHHATNEQCPSYFGPLILAWDLDTRKLHRPAKGKNKSVLWLSGYAPNAPHNTWQPYNTEYYDLHGCRSYQDTCIERIRTHISRRHSEAWIIWHCCKPWGNSCSHNCIEYTRKENYNISNTHYYIILPHGTHVPIMYTERYPTRIRVVVLPLCHIHDKIPPKMGIGRRHM